MVCSIQSLILNPRPLIETTTPSTLIVIDVETEDGADAAEIEA